MSASDKQKAKKRKNRKAAKSSTNPTTTPSAQNLPSTTTSEELAMIQRLMDADNDCGVPTPPPLRGPNPYLGGERCLLCRCERPDPPQHKHDNKTKEEEDGQDKGVGTLSQLPLWVCPDCRKTVEEEEKKAAAYDSSALLEQELRLETPALSFLPDLAGEFASTNNSVCTCEACTERRQIEAEHEKETQELQQCWMELRHVVRCIYHETGTGLTEGDQDGKGGTSHDIAKMTTLVHRLCVRDAHQLYQRLESQGREYVIEMKVRLLKQLTSGHKTPAQARQFVAMLLEEYSNLCAAAKTLASFLTKLTEHLKRFNLTWELHNKHLFQSIIYSDPFVQNSLPMLIAQMRSGAASKESYHEDTYPNILHRYLKFDDEMSVISVVWRDCQQLLETYNDEQAALRAKQKMLKDDWEFFKAQRRLLEQQQQVLKKTPTSTSAHSFEAQFTETMRHILQGTKPAAEECHCPNCNRKRLPCEECSLSHVMPYGVLGQELPEHQQHAQQVQFPQPVSLGGTTCPTSTNTFNIDSSSPYMIDVTPPSMSSTNSSSGSSSPINVDPKRLVLPLDVCPESFELTDDEIPEEIEEDEESGSDSDGDDEEEDDDDEDYLEDQADEGTERTGEEGAELTAAMDGNLDHLPEGSASEYSEGQAPATTTSTAPVLGLPLVTAEAMKTDCDCTHCTKARMELLKPAEEAVNQCQCHACLMQSGKTVPTCLPQHIPTAPRPAAFNLYPHIHGSNSLHTAALHGHSPHVRPVLQSQLYELQSPANSARQPKSLLNPQKKHNTNFSLDLDSHEALHEHIYHAYGEWDNAYDSTKLMFSSHKYVGGLGSELFSAPPPPLMNGNPFVSVADQLSTEAALSLAASGAKPASLYQHSTMAALSNPLTSMATSTAFANTSMATANGEHIHTEACFKNMKPLNRTLLNSSQALGTMAGKSPVTSCVSSSASSAGGGTATTTSSTSNSLGTTAAAAAAGAYSDHCLKHNPFLHTHHSSFTSTHAATTTISASPPLPSHPLPGKLTPELIRSAAINVTKEEAARTLANNPAGAAPHGLPHTCSHQHNPATSGASQPFINPNAPGLQLLNNNNITVSLPTGVCQDPECDGHHDAEYDSIDDSCSEQSSSTSTSNQKDGKYCDCCYCEFFGHSNPPQTPTSRNYAEIRDRLRLRLKKKTESTATTQTVEKPRTELKIEEPRQPPPPPPKEEVLGDRGVDELLRFINGDEKDGKSASAKAAKRARQKQKKAEEKARREEEARLAEERERAIRAQQEALAKAMEEAKRQQQQQRAKKEEMQKKRKSKQKEHAKENEENQNPHNQDRLHTHHPETQLKSQGGRSCTATTATSSATKSGSAKGNKHEQKRGEPDGLPTPRVVTPRLSAHTASSAGDSSSVSRPSRQWPKQQPQNTGTTGGAVSKSESVINNNSSPRPEKNRKGRTVGHQPPTTCSSSANLSTSNLLSQQSSLGQSQNQVNGHQPQHQRSNKSPPHSQQQHQQQQHNVAASQQHHQHQPQNGRANTSNKVSNSSSKVSKVSSPAVNARVDQRAVENGSSGHSNHVNHVHTPIQQQHLSNGTNNSKKGKRTTNMVNGSPLPSPPITAPAQHHARQQQVQNSQPGQVRSEGQHRPNNVLTARSEQGHCLNTPMVNGNSQTTAESSHQHSPADKRQGKLPQLNTVNMQKDAKSKLDEKICRAAEQLTVSSGAKPKKNKRKNKSAEDLDEIFMPKDLDPDNGEIDEQDREIEEFKRFCLDSTPMPKREKLQVNMNLKDIFNKKKSGVSCA